MTAVAEKRVFTLADEQATVELGAALAEASRWQARSLTIWLQGDLGAGKTTLSRGLIHSMGHTGAVKSPTYTLVEPYEHLSPPVYHFDLYRLGDAEELEYMGIRDYFGTGALCLIEWPERGAAVLPEPDLVVSLGPHGTGREATLAARSPRGQEALARVRPVPADGVGGRLDE